MIVYLITNKINGKRYVGQHSGSNLDEYWKRNVYLAESGYQGKRALYRAIRRYGAENFETEVLVTVLTKQEMDRYEIALIQHLDTTNPENGYNITLGGGGSLGVKMSEETRAKMSKAREGRRMSEENRLKFIKRIKGNKFAAGRKMTEDNFQKLMAAHIGVKRSEESKIRMSKSHIGKKASEETKIRMSISQHVRRHVKRGIINPNCKFCQGVQCQSTTE